eukprot:scaffold1002_cov117-Isochrysis_galbana.AAC.11
MPPTRGTRPRSAGQSTVQSRDQSGTSSSMSQHQPLWPAPARHPTPVWNSRATANRAAPPHLRRTAAPVASSRAHPALLRRLVPSGAGLACRAGRTSWQLTQRPPLPTRRVTGQSRTPPRAPAPMPSSAHWPTGPPCAPAASRPKPRPPPARHRTAGEASNRRPRARRAAAAAVAAAAASRPRRRPARACAPRTPRHQNSPRLGKNPNVLCEPSGAHGQGGWRANGRPASVGPGALCACVAPAEPRPLEAVLRPLSRLVEPCEEAIRRVELRELRPEPLPHERGTYEPVRLPVGRRPPACIRHELA